MPVRLTCVISVEKTTWMATILTTGLHMSLNSRRSSEMALSRATRYPSQRLQACSEKHTCSSSRKFWEISTKGGQNYSLSWWHHYLNDFHSIGPLWGEFTSHRKIPNTKGQQNELWCFLTLKFCSGNCVPDRQHHKIKTKLYFKFIFSNYIKWLPLKDFDWIRFWLMLADFPILNSCVLSVFCEWGP